MIASPLLISAILFFIPMTGRQTPAVPSAAEFAERLLDDVSAQDRLLEDNPRLVTLQLFDALKQLGNSAFSKADSELALKIDQVTLKVAERIGDDKVLAIATFNLGLSTARAKEFESGIQYIDRAIVLYRRLGDAKLLGNALNSKAIYLRRLGRMQEAITAHDESLKLAEATGDKSEVAKSLLNLGNAYMLAGNYQLALQTLQRCLNISEREKIRIGIAYSTNSLGELYYAEGDYERALDFYNRSLKVKEEVGNFVEIVNSLINIALVHSDMGRLDTAHQYLNRALALNANRDRRTTATIINDEGKLLMKQHRWTEAIARFDESLKITDAIQDRVTTADSLVHSGMAYAELRDFAKAREFANRALPLAHEMESPADESMARDLQGVAFEAEGKHAEAEIAFRDSVGIIEKWKDFVAGGVEEQQSFFEMQLTPYHHLLSLLVRQKRYADALVIAEREKARVLLTNIGQREQRTSASLRFVASDFGALIKDASMVVVEYAVTDRDVFLFVMNRGDRGEIKIRALSLGIKAADMQKRAQAFLHKMSSRDLDFRDDARALYRLLLEPAAAELQAGGKVLIVPDGVLWQLPFQPLIDSSDRFFIEDHVITLAPSLAVLREMREHRRDAPHAPRLLAIGDESVRMLPKLYGDERSRVYVGADARGENAKAHAAEFDVIHFTVHATLDDRRPMLSHLVLSDGMLEARDLAQMKLKASVLVLAACETARGRVRGGEGLVGMTWAAFVAGARTVVASQWKVDAASTSELMTAFHGKLQPVLASASPASSKAEALRSSILEIMKKPAYRHPFYWAGFVSIGESF